VRVPAVVRVFVAVRVPAVVRVFVLVNMSVFVMLRCVIQVTVEPLHVVVVVLVFVVHNDVKVAGVERAGKLARDPHLIPFEVQALQSRAKPLFVCAKVKQRTNYHIATNATVALKL